MKTLFLTFVGLLLFVPKSWSQHEGTIGFYNVENLFDTIDDPNKNDNEFLPENTKEWNSYRYDLKLQHLSKVINDMGNLWALGMAEIENQRVLVDLKSRLNNKNLSILHYESADERGIDVALFYDSTVLNLEKSGYLRYTTATSSRPTRDILWAQMKAGNDVNIFFLVNHWPSRYGGQEASNPNRVKAAKIALNFMDSVRTANPNAKFVFMGDLNDYPNNNGPQMVAKELTPMITKASGEYGGSYCYRNEWDILDHIMVSRSLFTDKSFEIEENSGKILSFPYLMETYKGQIMPLRTFAGKYYLKGYSDHLPVTIKVKMK